MSAREFESSFSRLLSPDFSGYVRDGFFDVWAALDSHISECDVLLRMALTLSAHYIEDLPGFPSTEDRMYAIEANIRTYREAIEAGVVEANRLIKELQGFPDRTPRAPGVER